VRSIQSKITLTYILISIVVTTLLAILISVEIEKSFFTRLTDQLETETRTIEALLSESMVRLDSRDKSTATLHTLSLTTRSRITLIALDGKVLYDSWVPDSLLSTLENHATREEVLAARQHGTGWDKRHSASTGEDLFYLAREVRFTHSPGSALSNLEYVRVAISLRDVDAAVSEIRGKVFLAGLFALIVIAIASRIVSRQITKPIVEIAAIVRDIQAGNLDRKLPVRSQDEIGQLAALINEMTGKLKEDIEQLKRLERVRSEFLGNVSHELRTPIFSMKGFLETLLEGAVNDPEVNVRFVEKAYKHANRLDSLLSDLIEISRIESGEMKMSFRYFDVASLLRQTMQDSSDQSAKKNQKLNLDTPEGELMVLGDKERLRLAIGNIVDNAIKYSPSEATITIRLSASEALATISISDNGPGIEAEHMPRIFERFYRVDKNRSREVGGTGLGLAIVKHIVEAHGTKVSVFSEIGKGTTFTFDLKR
jgi:two-component system, OmpR family, phosphate regulon sensor histidine kinase PhoR